MEKRLTSIKVYAECTKKSINQADFDKIPILSKSLDPIPVAEILFLRPLKEKIFKLFHTAIIYQTEYYF